MNGSEFCGKRLIPIGLSLVSNRRRSNFCSAHGISASTGAIDVASCRAVAIWAF
jgi:hypothetical protein